MFADHMEFLAWSVGNNGDYMDGRSVSMLIISLYYNYIISDINNFTLSWQKMHITEALIDYLK